METGRVYDYIGLAMSEYNIKNPSAFTVALNEKSHTVAGLHWVYLNETNLSYYEKEENRRKYLIEALLMRENIKPLICLETNEIFVSKIELSEKIKVTTAKINYHLKKHKCLKHENKNYILLSDYNSRIQQ